MLKIALSQIFDCQPDGEAHALMVQYPNMVKWWINRAGEFTEGSFSKFRNQFYEGWKKEWKGYNSQHAQTSSLVAYSALQLWKESAEKTKALELKWNFAVISPRIAKIEDCKLVFPTKLPKKAHVKLIAENPRQQVLLEQAQNEHWQVGQSILTPEWCAVPFTRYLDLSSEKDRVIKELMLAKTH
jgi:hypothetical protein